MCVSLLKFYSTAPLSRLCRGLEAWGEQWEWAGGAGGGGGGGRGCILNPTNPAVLNLCLPVPEEEAAGRTHSAPPGPNPVSPPVHRHTTGSEPFRLFSLLYLRRAGSDRFISETLSLLGFNPNRGGFENICCRRDERRREPRPRLQQTGVRDPGEGPRAFPRCLLNV